MLSLSTVGFPLGLSMQEAPGPRPHRHLHFLGMKLLLLQVLTKNLSMVHLLFLCELTKGVAAYRVMALGHSQRASTLAGHTGETLAPGKVVYSHLVKADILPPQLLLPLQDGCGCEQNTWVLIARWLAQGSRLLLLI